MTRRLMPMKSWSTSFWHHPVMPNSRHYTGWTQSDMPTRGGFITISHNQPGPTAITCYERFVTTNLSISSHVSRWLETSYPMQLLNRKSRQPITESSGHPKKVVSKIRNTSRSTDLTE